MRWYFKLTVQIIENIKINVWYNQEGNKKKKSILEEQQELHQLKTKWSRIRLDEMNRYIKHLRYLW